MFLIVFLLLWGGMHVYVVQRLLSIPTLAAHLPLKIFLPIVTFLALSYVASRIMEHYELGRFSHVLEYIGATWVGIVFLLFAMFVFADALSGFGLFFREQQVLIRTVALCTACVLIAISYVQAWRTPVVTEHEVAMPGLPASADGTVVVVGTDLHLGSMLNHRWASARAEQFKALKPDLILLIGDIFEGEKETHAGWLPVLQKFRAPQGVYAVTGNHEFYAGPDAIIELMGRAGFRVLRDENVELLPGLVIAGVDDPAFRKRGNRDQSVALDQAFADHPGGATIFLSHTPVLAEKAAQLGAGLMLSGHTHKGQIWPFQYIVRLAFRLVSGRYDISGMTAIVCRGTGTWGPRMRLWQPSEILRITLKSM
ncbi:metallophosphoesterase [Candidatus Korobacter versatilis]|uniref:metallophosphoesterase n=1 Tax=Candidatus Korobacter versatilis TaxID=658062 RepID=UPI0005A476BF|nr:metallophosphoesterase [Candidatus Koribacter versatilis]